MVIRFCEFTGDGEHQWDEVGFKKSCGYLGFNRCTRYNVPLIMYDGWRVCCAECNIPVQIKEIKE